jgi:hypothetical protein
MRGAFREVRHRNARTGLPRGRRHNRACAAERRPEPEPPMTALILSKPMPPDVFAQHLRDRGFAHPIHTSLDDVDPATVRGLMAWRLPAGVLPRLPNLQLLFCCAAGTDKLLATPDLPAGLPIARVADEAQALELSQYVVHAALDHLRLAPRYRAQQAARDWSRHRAPSVGVPALVLGLGPIGLKIARSLAALGFALGSYRFNRYRAAGKDGPPGCRLYHSAATALAVGVHTVVVLAVHAGMEGECGDSSRVWRGGVGGRCGDARTRAGCVRVCTRAGCFVRCSTCRTSRVVPASLSRCRTVSACGTAHAASQYASVAHGHCGCTAVGRMQQRACSAL